MSTSYDETRSEHWVSEPTQTLLRPCEGDVSEELKNFKPITIMGAFKRAKDLFGDRLAYAVEKSGEWVKTTWSEYYDKTMHAARALCKLGLNKRKGVGVIGFNSPEWFLAHLSSIFANGISAGIYSTNGPSACQYVLNHCDAEICFVEDERQLKKIIEVWKDLPNLKTVVMWSGTLDKSNEEYKNVLTWAEFMKLGEENDDVSSELESRMEEQTPGQCASLIYTSGTTAEPKACMLSHDNMTFEAKTVCDHWEVTVKDCTVSYLPLSHIAAQMIDIHGSIYTGHGIYFARPDALKGSLSDTLKRSRPTFFVGVPRVWEKIQEAMKAAAGSKGGLTAAIASWAKGVGLAKYEAEMQGKGGPWTYGIANALVFSKVRKALGFDRLRLAISAAAPISMDTLRFFVALSIPIMECYGMSEGTAGMAFGKRGAYELGTCGKAVPGFIMTPVNEDEDGGELVARGRSVFMGYMRDVAANQAVFDAEGGFHTGDMGKYNEKGLLKITGRCKDLIITAGGENVPPILIEDNIKARIPFVANTVLIGDARKFLTILFTLKAQPQKDGLFSDNLDKGMLKELEKIGSSAKTVTEAKECPEIKKFIEAQIDAYNQTATSRAQRVQKFTILPTDFSIAGGEMTPTMKIKRKVVQKKYADEIEAMYN